MTYFFLCVNGRRSSKIFVWIFVGGGVRSSVIWGKLCRGEYVLCLVEPWGRHLHLQHKTSCAYGVCQRRLAVLSGLGDCVPVMFFVGGAGGCMLKPHGCQYALVMLQRTTKPYTPTCICIVSFHLLGKNWELFSPQNSFAISHHCSTLPDIALASSDMTCMHWAIVGRRVRRR